MNKTIIASIISLSTLIGAKAQADIALTTFSFAGDFTASGTLLDVGGGFASGPQYLASFPDSPWTLTQETLFMDNTGSWNGSSNEGLFNYDSQIAAMTADQVAVGLYFNWTVGGDPRSNETAILEIFDCTSVPGICTGQGVSLANGPFGDSNPDGSPTGQGFVYQFSGTGSATVVPVPAAAWLMGSGLLGLVGVARRKHVFSKPSVNTK